MMAIEQGDFISHVPLMQNEGDEHARRKAIEMLRRTFRQELSGVNKCKMQE